MPSSIVPEKIHMDMEELNEGQEMMIVSSCTSSDWSATRALVGAGGRALFYPTLLYNLVRNMMQSEFRWWDLVDEHVLLGAVPFPNHVPRLKELGVHGVVTLNEPFETLVPTSLYHAHCISHLELPTRDYLFAPSISHICQAVDFIHKNASRGKTTYVHCKAGRGRSTTIVLCYLVKYREMTPECAYEYIRSTRPRVWLASAQWKAVKEFYNSIMGRASACADFDDGSMVVVTESDLAGYDDDADVCAEQSVTYKVQSVSQTAFAKMSCFWLKSSGGQAKETSVAECWCQH